MPRILPTLSPLDLWRQRTDIRPLWWRDMARYSCVGVALCIMGSYTVWEPIARIGALLLIWIVICAGMGSERRDDDDRRGGTRPHPWPTGGRGRRADRGPRRARTASPARPPSAPRPRTRRREPVA